jgi:Zn finger protein HypA/HybF involved in hydrogenase expression
MHELSVAVEVCRMAEERLRPEELARLRTVEIIVGDQAGLEPENLRFCLEALLGAPPFGRAVPAITVTPGRDLALARMLVDDDDPHD